MKKTLLRISILILFVSLSVVTMAQSSVLSTTSTFTNNNGSGQATFNFQNTNGYPIVITDIEGVTGVAGAQTCDLWYNPTPISGSPTVSAANGWVLAASGSYTGVANTSTTVTQSFISGTSVIIPPGVTYGMCVATTSQRYYTLAAGTTTISAGGCNLITGTSIGYAGGMPPTVPVNSPRGWIGKITFIPKFMGPNNAGISSLLVSPGKFCPSMQPVTIRVKNNGTNRIDSVRVNWKLNNVTQPTIYWTSPLDTVGGVTYRSDTAITLTSLTFGTTTSNTIKAWTSYPNGVVDTTNVDDTIQVVLKPGLSGIYTIGGTGANYPDIVSAVTDLNNAGVCGPVTFNVNAGTYNGKFSLNSIAGVTNVNTISFNGSSNTTCNIVDSASVPVVAFNSTSYVTFRNFNVTNKYAGLCAGIAVVGNTTNTNGSGTTVSNCVVNLQNAGTTASIGLLASGSPSAGANNYLDSITFDSNVVNGGGYGIMIYGNSTTPSSNYNRFHRIRYNTVNNIYSYGIYSYYIYNPIKILYNNINMGTTATTQYGLYNYYNYNSSTTVSTEIIGNKLQNPAYMGFYIYYNSSTATAPHRIYNNIIFGTQSYSTNYTVYLYTANGGYYEFLHNTINVAGSATTQYGFYYYNSTNVNGILCKNNIFSSRSTTGTTVYTVYFSSNPTTNVVNYNLYYNTLSTSLGYRGAAFTTANYKTTTTGGDSSFNKVVPFVSTTDLHLTDGCTRGVDLTASVPTDLTGNTRSTSPSQGAYEFASFANDVSVDVIYSPIMPISTGAQNMTVRVKNNGSTTVTSFNISFKLNGGTAVTIPWTGTLNTCDTVQITFSGSNQITLVSGTNAIKIYTWAPNGTTDGNTSNDTLFVNYLYLPAMSGTYTIGGTGANFTDVVSAVTALQAAGVSGPLNFVINPGTYNGQVVLNTPIYGSSPVNTVTFSGVNAATSIITANIGAATFLVNQVSYVIIKNLTVTNTYIGTCSGIAIVGNGTNNAGTGCIVKKCNVNIPNAGTVTAYGIVVTGSSLGIADANQWTDSVTIDSNTINGPYYGIQISTSGTGNVSHNRGHLIRGNMINAYYYGIRVYYIYNAVDILNNTITMNTTNASSYGIYFYYNQNSLSGTNSRIIGNNVSAGYAGIYFYYFTSPAGNRIPFYNNMFITYGASAYAATYVYSGAAGGNEVDYYHNSIYTQGASASYGLYYYNSAATGTSFIRNNIFAAAGSGTYPAYFSTNPTGNVINFNNYYNAAGGNLGYRGAAFSSTTYLSTTTGGDTSYNVLPAFVSASNLHLVNACLRGANFNSLFPTDIDGNTRNNPPVIGAHEASGTLNDVYINNVIFNTPIATGLQGLTVRIKSNNTANTTSMNIVYKLNNNTPVSVPWSGILNGCDTILYTFTGSNQLTLLPGYNSLIVYTSNPNGTADAVMSNDTQYLALTTVQTSPGSAIQCNATAGSPAGSNVRFQSKPSMNPTTAFTAECWVKLSNVTNNQKIVCKSSTTNGFDIGVQTGSIYPEVWTLANGTGSITLTAGTIPVNTWTHLAITWQSGVGMKAYINAVLVGSVLSSTATTMTPSGNDLTIGTNSWDFGHAAAGAIDEVRLWNVALDSFTIAKNMHRTLKGTEPGLISYIQFNEPNTAFRVSDPISGSVGIKGNAAVYSASSIPLGSDTSLAIQQTTFGFYQHQNVSLTIYDAFDNPCDLVITEIPFAPDSLAPVSHPLTSKYWVVRPFGNPGAYLANMTFMLPAGQLNLTDPYLGLYRRGFGSDGSWTLAKPSTSIGTTSVYFAAVDTFGQFTLGSNGTSPLPVSLISFGGKKVNDQVELYWITANEVDCKGFEIERSYRDLDHFAMIDEVASATTDKSAIRKYRYSDLTAEFSTTLFYRLKQVDNDGKYSYSPIVTIEQSQVKNAITVSPNPLSNAARLSFVSDMSENIRISISNVNGKEMKQFYQMINYGKNEITIDMSDFPSGFYTAKIMRSENVSTVKLVKE